MWPDGWHRRQDATPGDLQMPFIADDCREIFRDFREISSCFKTAGFLAGLYKVIPEAHGFYGVFEKGRTYSDWDWHHLIDIGHERAVAFFRRKQLDVSGNTVRLNPTNTVTIVFTATHCHWHQSRDGARDFFAYADVQSARQRKRSKRILVRLRDGATKHLPILNEDLCSYLSVAGDREKYRRWKQSQIVAGNKHRHLLLSTFLGTVLSLAILIAFFDGEEPAGADILMVALAVYFPAMAVSWVLLKIWGKLSGRRGATKTFLR